MDKKTKLFLEKGESLPIMETFYTIQGEGFHKGSASYFIRTGGCDVGCHWCDVKESWDENIHPIISVEEIVKKSAGFSDCVVVTGGEPLMWNMNPLTKALKKLGKKTHIETSGAYPLTGDWDWICLSPKKAKLPIQDAYNFAHELKIIIYNNHDFEFAEQEAKKVNKNAILYIQPEWSKREKMMPLMVDFIKKNPKWKVSLQTHKYLNIP
ncbi:7-carboxy-7-deazaguanine synthase QueE [Bacteroidota bacterium]|nr:7-carboxy-7-deazaguanine synthase QueE [Bacteroidota bacterium]